MSAKKKAAKKTRAKAKPAKKAAKKAVKKTKKTVKKKAVKKPTAKNANKARKAAPKKKVGKAAKKPVKKKPVKKTKAVKKTTGRKPAVKKTPPKAKPPKKATPKARVAKETTRKPSKDKVQATAAKPAPAVATKAKPRKARARRSSRRAAVIRRGPDGEILAPGDLLLPGGAKGTEEIQYLFRGCMAAEKPAAEEAINEILTKRGVPEGPGEREELQGELSSAQQRFGQGDLEPVIPVRANLRRTFEGVVDRARQRRRELGAFLRGLDMGHTETSHMDTHGEASLQSLMEWAARLENLVENLTEAPDANQGHYVQFHRVLDQLEASTEALILDVEQTLRRLRNRLD